MDFNSTPQKPIHGMLMEYAIAVHFFYHAAKLAMADVISEDPTANGLFPHTVSQHIIDMPEVDMQDLKGGDEAESDLELLLKTDEEGKFKELLAQAELED